MLDICNIYKDFGSLKVLKGVSAHVEKGEVIARADCAFGMGKMITVEVETRGDVFTVRAGGEVIVSCEIPDAPPVGATQFIANYSLATIYDFAVIPE